MCLFTLNKEPLVASEDIVCYKIVLIEKRFFGLVNVITTPFTNKKYYSVLNSITIKASNKHKCLERSPEYDEVLHEFYEAFIVDSQGVHCYATYEDAENAVNNKLFFMNMQWEKFHNIKIVKCIIPKGTYYWRNTEFLARYWKKHGQTVEMAAEKLLLYINN